MPTPMGDFHHPSKLNNDDHFKKCYKEAMGYMEQGLPAKDTCILVWGISERTYRKWCNWAVEDIEAGFDEEDSNLIKLMIGLAKEDAILHTKLSRTAIEMATVDRNSQMLQFLLKTRYGYSEKNKTELEVSTDEETPIKFEIVDMTPNEEE